MYQFAKNNRHFLQLAFKMGGGGFELQRFHKTDFVQGLSLESSNVPKLGS